MKSYFILPITFKNTLMNIFLDSVNFWKLLVNVTYNFFLLKIIFTNYNHGFLTCKKYCSWVPHQTWYENSYLTLDFLLDDILLVNDLAHLEDFNLRGGALTLISALRYDFNLRGGALTLILALRYDFNLRGGALTLISALRYDLTWGEEL